MVKNSVYGVSKSTFAGIWLKGVVLLLSLKLAKTLGTCLALLCPRLTWGPTR